ncbi:MAG TPA: DUF3124 domain-containing protein [Drouetiella sp.]
MPNSLLAAALLLVGVSLSSCEQSTRSESPHDAPAPESWQLHLKPTTLDKDAKLSMQESIYIPIYSHIYVENEKRVADLAATLSFRNIDPDKQLILKSVRYYSSDGKLIKEYLKSPVLVEPLATADFVIDKEDTSGGSGANFIVDWCAKSAMNEPLAEAVMVGTGSPQSMSFTSRGVVLKKYDSKPKE